jgi:hypothetical protein
MSLLNSIAGLSGGDPGANFHATAAYFNDDNYYGMDGLTLGVADGKQFTLSAWWYYQSSGGSYSQPRIISDAVAGPHAPWLHIDTTPHQFELRWDGGGSQKLEIEIDEYSNLDSWQHIIVSVDMSNSSKRHCIRNGTLDARNWKVYVNANLDFSNELTIGSWSSADRWNGGLSEIWFDNSYIDLSVSSNLSKFISSEGKPVYLGSNGQRVTGSAPLIYLGNPVDTWHVNLGTAGDFDAPATALTDYTSSPSD